MNFQTGWCTEGTRPRGEGNKPPLFCDLVYSEITEMPECNEYGSEPDDVCWQPGGDCKNNLLQVHNAEEDTPDQYTTTLFNDHAHIDILKTKVSTWQPTLRPLEGEEEDPVLRTYQKSQYEP